MFKLHLLALLLASVLYVPAGAATVPLEDETPTPDPKAKTITELEDGDATLLLTEESVTDELSTESDALTTANTENTTDDKVVIEVPEGSMKTAVLIGIIVGTLVAVGIFGAIIIIALKKMSGRYSP